MFLLLKRENKKLIFLSVEKKNQLDATQWFIELVASSTCFGNSYAHLQEHATIQMVTACGM
jgi:hypothetical protein